MTVDRGRYYPEMPPMLPGETSYAYTDRLTGADGKDQRPYDHVRNRQCSIGWHEECSEREISDGAARRCQCPCHDEPLEAEQTVDAIEEAVPTSAYEAIVRDRDSWQQAANRLGGELQTTQRQRDNLHRALQMSQGNYASLRAEFDQLKRGTRILVQEHNAELADARDRLNRIQALCDLADTALREPRINIADIRAILPARPQKI